MDTTGCAWSELADCGTAEARLAVRLALTTFNVWRTSSPDDRSSVLLKWRDILVARERLVAHLITSETGKPIAQALQEVQHAAMLIRWTSHELMRYRDHRAERKDNPNQLSPVGPVFASLSFQFQVAEMAYKAAAALAAGCPVILLAAPESPLSALLLAQFWEEAGGESGTLHVLTTGDRTAVLDFFIDEPAVKKIALPDTSEIAAFLSEKAEKLTGKTTFDIKDNVPFVVFADADIKAAAKAAVAFRFRESAHCPVRVKTLHVHESVARAFCDEIANEVHQLVAGNPHDYRTAVGVLPNLKAGDYLEHGIKDALARGASIVTGGVRCELRVEPTILVGVATDAVLLREDLFGPVVPIFVFSSNSEVSDLIQTLPCPIAASIWTNDPDSIQCISDITDLSAVRTNEYRDFVPDVLFERLTYHKAPGGRFEWTIPDFFSTTNDVDFGNQQLLRPCVD